MRFENSESHTSRSEYRTPEYRKHLITKFFQTSFENCTIGYFTSIGCILKNDCTIFKKGYTNCLQVKKNSVSLQNLAQNISFMKQGNSICILYQLLFSCLSGDLKSGNIQNPDFLKVRLQIVPIQSDFKWSQPFENWKNCKFCLDCYQTVV